jgi:predicted lipid-binding transport protein (Tim44 family)
MTAVNDGHMFATPYNVVAGFRTRQQAETAARRLTSAGLPRASVEVGTRPDERGPVETAELRAEMQDELDRSWAGPTARQTSGAVLGTAGFAFIGLIVGLLGGLAANLALGLDMSLAGTMAIGGVVGLVGGATIGFVAGGGIAPRVAPQDPEAFDDPRPAAERDVLVAVHVAEPETAERAARMLRDDLHADQVHLVDADGTPLPPQHDHPRPADPQDYWWKRAGEG